MLKFKLPMIAVVTAAAFVGCAPDAPDAAESEIQEATAREGGADLAAEEQAIRQRIEAYEVAANESAEAFGEFFLPDGVLMAPNAPTAEGPEAVAEAMAPTFQVVDRVEFNTRSIALAESGDLAVERGHYSLSGSLPDGSPLADEGSYLVTWKKQDGQWMVLHDIFNSDRPASGSG